ncbi:GATA type DNA binding domain fused to an AT hook [Cryptosporidium sp. chipmunk genotype I]|uniref:GATA type DNA binding domain fused to an AT hook n=1 Tax=Cryptosporidium sp. chipmunk genotype I TaxID=1280935 RepID=UPI003519D9D0|nr:GATA type DNA binding domain fused to an AT hook [Cryptosporidium sp. chipmunk genotype I]
MKSQIETNRGMNGGPITIPLIENIIQSKDDRLVKRSNILPNLTSCDLLSDDQSLIGSRTLSGDSQCLENYPFLSMIGQQPLNNAISNERILIDSVRNVGCDSNTEGDMIFGYKNTRYFDTEIQSIKNMDSKLKQTNERRAGRPPLDRSDYFCQICSATKTPQWRYISVCSVESKLRVCNACWMKQRKKRDGKCLPLQIGMNNNLNCPNIGLLKTQKIGVNKENYDPQKQSYTRVGGVGYKISGMVGKNLIANGRNVSMITNGANKDLKVAPHDLTENLNPYVANDNLKNDTTSCNINTAINNGQCIKPVSFRSSPYSVSASAACSNSTFDCQTCGSSQRCYCSSIIGLQGVSLTNVITNDLSEESGKIVSSSSEVGIHCSFNSNISIDKAPSIDVCGQTNATGMNYKNNGSNSSLLDISNHCTQNVFIDGNKLSETHIDERRSLVENFSMSEQISFDINCAIETCENNLKVGLEESYGGNCLKVNVTNNIEESPLNSTRQTPTQSSSIDSYPGRVGSKFSNGLLSRKCSDNRINLISSNKFSVSTPVHHQASTTVSPNTNYCNISSYTSSPCQSFSTYDGPFLEDPNKTMYISSGTYFYSNTETNRWNEETPVQSSVGLSSCVGNSNNTENEEKMETLSFPLDQDTHNNALSQNNEQIEHDQVNYTIFSKHLVPTESWNCDYLNIDMFCIPTTDKTSISSEASTSAHYSVGSKFFNSSVSCTIPAAYSAEVQQEDESSSQNDCNSWDFDSSSISCIDTWQNSLWYDSYSNGFCKLS